MSPLQAIETRYAGCRFRSRLEARWAVFFDSLGIAWEYEPEGYELPTGRYLPDFWLPGVTCRGETSPDLAGVWFEVKADHVDHDPRWNDLAATSNHAVVVGRVHPRHADEMDLEVIWLDAWPLGLWGEVQSTVLRDVDHTFCDCIPGIWTVRYGPESNYHHTNHPQVELALVAARSARFEHGERG